jgi:predicted transcriptional regulator
MNYAIPGLAPTETEIMSCLWAHGPLTVRQVRAMIQSHRPIAYTTILTMSSRMEEKGLITRHTTGAAYNGTLLLTPAVTRVELLTQAVLAVCRNLNARANDPPLSYLRWATPMHRADEQATRETTMGWLGRGLMALFLLAIPVMVLIPAARLAAGVLLLLVGLCAWVSMSAVRSP